MGFWAASRLPQISSIYFCYQDKPYCLVFSCCQIPPSSTPFVPYRQVVLISRELCEPLAMQFHTSCLLMSFPLFWRNNSCVQHRMKDILELLWCPGVPSLFCVCGGPAQLPSRHERKPVIGIWQQIGYRIGQGKMALN